MAQGVLKTMVARFSLVYARHSGSPVWPGLPPKMRFGQSLTGPVGGGLPDVRIVSISVDPKDTPADLKAFGSKYGGATAGWIFLAGPLIGGALAGINPMWGDGPRSDAEIPQPTPAPGLAA